MVHASSWWKISPGKGGKYWNDWLQNNYCILFHWEEQDYFDQTDMNLQQNYSSSEEFLKITGFVGRPPNDWRMQLGNFVWGVKEGDILFLYKKGFFIAWGMVDMDGKYYYNRKGHCRKIVWKRIYPPLDLKNSLLYSKLSIKVAGTLKNITEFQDKILKLLFVKIRHK